MDLIEQNRNNFRFNLWLKLKGKTLYAGWNGLLQERHQALYVECGYKGMTVEAIMADLNSEGRIHWMHEFSPKDFEIVSAPV